MIAILCPSRGRPEQCKRMLDSIKATSTNAQPFITIDEKEKELYSRCLEYGGYTHTPEGLPTAHKWNFMAEEIMEYNDYKLFMLGADDMVFETPGWDKALIDHYNALENKIHVYHFQDSRDKDGTPHPIVTREFIDAMGYAFVPIFLHWQTDTWTVDIARANNCFTHLREHHVSHIKPSDSGQGDDTHNRIREWGWPQRDKWVAEKMAHVLEGEKKRLNDVYMHEHRLKYGV